MKIIFLVKRIALRVPPAETRLTVYRRFENETRPKGTATFYDMDLFEQVCSLKNYCHTKTCYMENIVCISKLHFGKVSTGGNQVEGLPPV